MVTVFAPVFFVDRRGSDRGNVGAAETVNASAIEAAGCTQRRKTTVAVNDPGCQSLVDA